MPSSDVNLLRRKSMGFHSRKLAIISDQVGGGPLQPKHANKRLGGAYVQRTKIGAHLHDQAERIEAEHVYGPNGRGLALVLKRHAECKSGLIRNHTDGAFQLNPELKLQRLGIEGANLCQSSFGCGPYWVFNRGVLGIQRDD